MNSDDVLKLDVSLEKLSAIALAIGFWENPDVKEKINKDFWVGRLLGFNLDKVNCTNKDDDDEDETTGKKIIRYIFQKLDAMKVPDKIKRFIKSLVVIIGQKISYWRQYVTDVLKLRPKYAGKIYWTAYGQIDELKVMREFWMKDSDFTNEKCRCFLRSYSYHCLTAMYAEENLAENHFKNMEYKINLYLPAAYKKQVETLYGIIATWTCFCTSQARTPGLKLFKSFGKAPDLTPAKDLLFICIENENNFGAKYFWGKLNPSEKKSLVTETATKCLKLKSPLEYNLRRQSRTTYKTTFTKEKSTNMLLFFINEMTEIERIEFISENFMTIFLLFLQVWPYQELCEKLVQQMWDHIPQVHKEILLVIFNYIIPSDSSKTEYPEYFTNKNFYKKILRIVMEKIPKKFKLRFFTWNNFKVVKNVYEKFDNEVLNIILNDKDFKGMYRTGMIIIGEKYIKATLLKGDVETVNEFVKNMDFTDGEIKSFKGKCNLLNIFLANGELALAEKHLNWLVDSDVEKNEMKIKVDAFDICFVLIRNNKFEAVDEFLSWRFDLEEERENVKKKLKSDELIKNKIFQIWGSCGINPEITDSTCSLKCSKLLKWFLGSEENGIEFRKTKLIQDEFLLEKYWNALYGTKTLQNLNNLLNFCLMTSEEIEMLKIDIANNITWWIETYAVEKDQFDFVQAVVNWVYENNKEEGKKVIENYINSPRGSLLIINMFKNCDKKSPSVFLDLFNNMPRSLDFYQLKMLVDGCDESIVGQNVISCIKSLLDIRQKDMQVDVKDLEDFIRFENYCWKRHYDHSAHEYGRFRYSSESSLDTGEEEENGENDDNDDDDDDDGNDGDRKIIECVKDDEESDDSDWETNKGEEEEHDGSETEN